MLLHNSFLIYYSQLFTRMAYLPLCHSVKNNLRNNLLVREAKEDTFVDNCVACNSLANGVNDPVIGYQLS